MTEADWLRSADPQKMLAVLRGRTSDRKLRLFAVACCRQIWPLFLGVRRSREAVVVSERFADGSATREELKAVRKRGRGCEVATTRLDAYEAALETSGSATHTVRLLAIDYPGRDPILAGCTTHTAAADRLAEEQNSGQCRLIREIFGNPFRPVILDPCCRSATVIALATAIYDMRRFDDLPVLADALEEAGCMNEATLGHLRGPEPHTRGCWALDLALGKE